MGFKKIGHIYVIDGIFIFLLRQNT